ncbi:hypothetical protein FSP39_007478 [Pinctada imbricata]|uniref:Ribosomal RNA-processing protein 43 n=1 Tax=Pinctada imbricata TaxID=66713 RepID=A0AA88Y830_PINIB|nr:hypothetical protein FSP39_007478 [Pinctada imbricata]
MVDHFKIARPLEFYEKFIQQEVRPDGRELGEFRSTVCNLSCITTANGSALIKIGNTTIICGIKAELASPASEEPCKGFIIPNLELSPMCSSRFRSGPPGEQAQVASQFLADVIKNSKCVDLETLCVESGKLVWVLHCDLICLDYDGNITDASILALIAALQTTKLPKVKLNEDTDKFETFESDLVSLALLSHPVSTTFSILGDQILIVDPTSEEESLSMGTITIVALVDKICMVYKPGGNPIASEQLPTLFERAIERGKEVRSLVDKTFSSAS